jgi:hypothetical protein
MPIGNSINSTEYKITIPSTDTTTWYIGDYPPQSNFNYYDIYPSVIYKYQVKCPKSSCKTNNWLEIDKVKPCVKCGAKLKAVLNEADYEIPVER